jgi:hypothetical protein
MATQTVSQSKPIPQARKAEKRQVKLKLGIQGPSGSGKTWGALALAKNLWPEAKVLVIDTENESASLYADNFAFDTIPLDPPFESARYEACLDYAADNKYDVVIMDSVTHQWDGEGGILRRKEEMDRRPGANSWANWTEFTPEHTHFVEVIKQAPFHIIATMRSKQDYILQTNDKGKSKPIKVGMAPIQRDGFDYEFSLVFDVQMDHKATVGKNRTGLFEGKVLNLADEKVAKELRAWLESGKPQVVASVAAPVAAAAPAPAVAPPKPNGYAPATAKVSEWTLDGNQLTCFVYEVQKRKDRNQKDFIAVKHNGKVLDKDMAFCFHAKLFDALLEATGRTCVFLVDSGKFITIADLISMDGVEFREGKVYQEIQPGLEMAAIGDDDIPF